MRPALQDLERQSDYGERRLAQLERLHAQQAERTTAVAHAAAAEFREAQAAWREQRAELQRALHMAEESARAAASADGNNAAAVAEAAASGEGEMMRRLGERLKEESAEVARLREELAGAQEAIGILVAGGSPSPGGDGGSGGENEDDVTKPRDAVASQAGLNSDRSEPGHCRVEPRRVTSFARGPKVNVARSA